MPRWGGSYRSCAGSSRRLLASARMSSAAALPSRRKRCSSGSPSRAKARMSARLSWMSPSISALASARWSEMVCRRCAAASMSGLEVPISSMGVLGRCGQLRGGPAQLDHERRDIARGLRQAARCGLDARQRARDGVQVGVAEQLVGAPHHLAGIGHQLRQAGEEDIELRGRGADHRVLDASDGRGRALAGTVVHEIDIQQPRHPLQRSWATVCSEIGVARRCRRSPPPGPSRADRYAARTPGRRRRRGNAPRSLCRAR